jgi:hypothetical protein
VPTGKNTSESPSELSITSLPEASGPGLDVVVVELGSVSGRLVGRLSEVGRVLR